MKTKICSKCKIEKDVKEFYKDKRKIDGLYPSCKQCKTKNVKKFQKKKYIKLEDRKIITGLEKILNEIKQNGRMSLKDLKEKFGKTTPIELIQLVDDRKIGMADIVGQDLQYYIKR